MVYRQTKLFLFDFLHLGAVSYLINTNNSKKFPFISDHNVLNLSAF